MRTHSLDAQPAHSHLWFFVVDEWFLNEKCERGVIIILGVLWNQISQWM